MAKSKQGMMVMAVVMAVAMHIVTLQHDVTFT